MKREHIELLKCIECLGVLVLSNDHKSSVSEDFIERGVIRCLQCGTLFPVIDSVGVFFKKSLLSHFLNDYEKRICASLGLTLEKPACELLNESLLTKQVADNWSYQWNTQSLWVEEDFDKDDIKGERCFRKFIRIEPEEYVGKRIVVWCGGNGREAYHISKNNTHLLIVNEIGDEIYRIRGLIDRNINLLLLRCDMLYNPLRCGVADISICDHALQHIVDKPGAISAIVNVLASGGTAAVCVYSYENNFLMTHIIEPLKGILHKIPLKAQEKVALIPAIIIYLLIKLFYIPSNSLLPSRLCKKIPLFDHMMFWSKGNFELIRTSCFDLIHAPVSYHFRRNEVQKLAQLANLHIDKLINTHGTTWSMTARKQE